MKNLESKLQILCVEWFRLQFPNVLIFSIPNGGQRSLITAKILKAEGTVSGVADLQIMKAKKGYNGCISDFCRKTILCTFLRLQGLGCMFACLVAEMPINGKISG